MPVQFQELPNKVREAYAKNDIENIWASSTGPGAVFVVITVTGQRHEWAYFQGKGWTKVRNG
jgi:hypothetical protein